MSQKNNSEAVLISFDESKFNAQIENLQQFIPSFEVAISIYNSLGIGDFQKENFNALFLSPNQFLFQELMKGKPLEVSGMQVSKEKIFDLLEKPAGYFSLIDAIKDLENTIQAVLHFGDYPGEKYFHKLDEKFLDCFEFDTNEKIVLKHEIKNMLKLRNEVYIKTDDAKLVHSLFSELSKIFNQSDLIIAAVESSPFHNIENFLRPFMRYDADKRQYQLEISRIKSVDDGLIKLTKPFPSLKK